MLRIKEMRIAKDLTQEKLAALMNLPVARVHLIETGDSEPTASEIAEFAKIFNCPIDYLLGKIDTFNRFAQFRQEKTMSQDEFAAYLGVRVETLKEWENGTSVPSADLLQIICNTLNCSADYLLGKSQINIPHPPVSTQQTSTNTTQKGLKPIICPHCGRTNLAFVTEYHKSYSARIVKFIFGFILILFGLDYLAALISLKGGDDSVGGMLFFAMVFFIAQGVQDYIESRTHVQGICKDCGHLWLLN